MGLEVGMPGAGSSSWGRECPQVNEEAWGVTNATSADWKASGFQKSQGNPSLWGSGKTLWDRVAQ